jgi:hypothetical protein
VKKAVGVLLIFGAVLLFGYGLLVISGVAMLVFKAAPAIGVSPLYRGAQGFIACYAGYLAFGAGKNRIARAPAGAT